MKYGFDKKRNQPASHVAAITKNSNFKLIAVCDKDPKLRNIFKKKLGKQISVFADHIKLIEFLNSNGMACDLCAIATPENTHYTILCDLIKNFKNKKNSTVIFCEKPITPHLESAKSIKQLLRKTRIKLVINHSRRWSIIWQKAFKFKNKIGKIERGAFYFSTSPENKKLEQIRDGIHIGDFISWFKLQKKISINRLYLPYFVYDFYLWGSNGKIEILYSDEVLNLYQKRKSKRFKGFNELVLIYSIRIKESMIENAYKEFANFFHGNKTKLSTDICDGISALNSFEKYVYEKRLFS